MRLSSLLLAPLKFVVGVFIVLDEIARPFYRPVGRWVASLRLMEALERRVAALPRYLVLLALAVPFAVAEPLKLYGVYMLGTGRLVLGLLVLVFAYLASFILVERIYHAGRTQLLSIGWFAWVMGLIVGVRTRLTNWFKATAAWRVVVAVRERIRAFFAAMRA